MGRGEISNHLFGIAIDVDPSKNSCCDCTEKWRRNPFCKRKLPVHERMVMPVCWVQVFTRYGFHWLGDDRTEDTMHFEFLGKPEVVERAGRANP
jgi:hypothetical protein